MVRRRLGGDCVVLGLLRLLVQVGLLCRVGAALAAPQEPGGRDADDEQGDTDHAPLDGQPNRHANHPNTSSQNAPDRSTAITMPRMARLSS